ncbi:MAG: hypothetical protein KGJ74_04155 [Betaproteobacteria bacterium]|jgi:hypothetical protein|uniref:Uncharacterized protein n=1 Tax=Thiomonas delicata TaxID=364030 RepID=A0A238D6W4_THIDL|nr:MULTISPECIES: hypothetical protein [Thiomonas]MDE2128844.1 hypothetical protein [Betaproteobacteria bacterium]OZB44241.1 MAG: hypothetical protein B7X46_09660 [Thiomonas sp. 15-66-11]OZB50837.1 MAG: hypothetical protein B7X42_04260 [Thiomonas sp. 14-66-4]OZB65147.1 MAG: hypothetical protein B7X31_02510 [Thiomonas sp. 13-66-29]SBP88894.1 conserved hypothetical protein [Thiomonas delicata]
MNTNTTITAAEIDRWRAGMLDAEHAHRVQDAVQSNPALAEQARFGARVAAGLAPLPQLAARRMARKPARKLRWPRVMAAGLVTASLATFTLVALPLLTSHTQAPMQPMLNAQTADAVQNMDFYEWLASHPQALQDVRHANPA